MQFIRNGGLVKKYVVDRGLGYLLATKILVVLEKCDHGKSTEANDEKEPFPETLEKQATYTN